MSKKKPKRIKKKEVSLNYRIAKLDLNSELVNDRSIFANGYRIIMNWEEYSLNVPFYEERKYYNE